MLKSEDELFSDEDKSKNEVTTENSNGLKKLQEWLGKNKERVAGATQRNTLPYFIRDNFKGGDVSRGYAWLADEKTAQPRLISPRPNAVCLENKTEVQDFLPEQTNGMGLELSANQEKGVSLVLKYTNIAESSIDAFSRKPEADVFSRAELDRLRKASSASELKDAVSDIEKLHQKNHPNEFAKLKDVAEDVYEECLLEVNAVYDFSNKGYKHIRAVQRSEGGTIALGSRTLAEVEEKAASIERFIECSPKWDGSITYRGIALSDKDLDKMLQDLKSDRGDMGGTSSWTTDKSMAIYYSGLSSMGFRDIKSRHVVLVAKQQGKATPIKHISKFASENEVICSKEVKWRYIGEHTETENGRDYLIIEVEPL